MFHSCSCRCCSPLNTLPVCVSFLQLSLLCVLHSCSCCCCSPLNTLPVCVCSILAAVAAAHHSTPYPCVFHSCSCRCCSPLNTLPVCVSFLQLSLLLTTQHPALFCFIFAAVAAAHHSTPYPCVCSILAAVAAAHHLTPCLFLFHSCSCRCCSLYQTRQRGTLRTALSI